MRALERVENPAKDFTNLQIHCSFGRVGDDRESARCALCSVHNHRILQATQFCEHYVLLFELRHAKQEMPNWCELHSIDEGQPLSELASHVFKGRSLI